MGKTEGGAVWLRADMTSPYDYWQYWRNTEDADVGKFLRLFTTLPIEEIKKLESFKDAEINEAKKILAFETTKILHGEAAAKLAAETARQTFEQGGVGADLPVLSLSEEVLEAGICVVDLFRQSGLVESNGEAKRLIQGGGARVNDETVHDGQQVLTLDDFTTQGYIKLSSGRKKHVLVKKTF
jgi:tyrosyl-tRNA synthetase